MPNPNLPMSPGNLAPVQYVSTRVTGNVSPWISSSQTTSQIIVLSFTLMFISGTNPTIQVDGAQDWPAGSDTFVETVVGFNNPQHFHSPTGLFTSAVGGNIILAVTGTTPVIWAAASYVDSDGTELF